MVQASEHVSVLDVFGRVVDKEDPELRGSIRGTGVLESAFEYERRSSILLAA